MIPLTPKQAKRKPCVHPEIVQAINGYLLEKYWGYEVELSRSEIIELLGPVLDRIGEKLPEEVDDPRFDSTYDTALGNLLGGIVATFETANWDVKIIHEEYGYYVKGIEFKAST